MTSDNEEAPGAHDLGRLRSLFALHAGPSSAAAAAQRANLTSDLVGARVTLPAELPLWHHVHSSSRELQRVAYDGSVLVVHNVESAGSSFLVHDEAGEPHSRRGPALTLHRPDDSGHDDLLVVFADDLSELSHPDDQG